MNIEQVIDLRAFDGSCVPTIASCPKTARSGAVLLHAYGRTKEQTLTLAFALAELDVATVSIDLPGHGHNRALPGLRMLDEVEAAIEWMRGQHQHVGCAGLGLGGRLALMSSADYIAALSPLVDACASAPGRVACDDFVRMDTAGPQADQSHAAAAGLGQLLKDLGPVAPIDRPCLLVHSDRDMPAHLESVDEFVALFRQCEVRRVASGARPDVDDKSALIRHLPRWLNHQELLSNEEAVTVTSRWLAQMPGLLNMSKAAHK